MENQDLAQTIIHISAASVKWAAGAIITLLTLLGTIVLADLHNSDTNQENQILGILQDHKMLGEEINLMNQNIFLLCLQTKQTGCTNPTAK